MDNLDFGWGFGLMVLSVMFLTYLLVVFLNYGLILWIGNKVQTFLNGRVWSEKEAVSIFDLLKIYLPITLVMQIGVNQFLTYLLINDNGQIDFINSFLGSFFIEVNFFYFSGLIGSLEVVGMTLLRQKYNQNWVVINKENWRKRVGRIWVLLLVLLVLRLFFRRFLNYYYIGNLSIYWLLWIVQISLVIGIVYLMLNYWNKVDKLENS